MRRRLRFAHSGEGEFLWLVSLSDLMILLFVFFVVLFSFAAKKMKAADYQKVAAVLKGNSEVTKTALDDLQKQLQGLLEKNNLTSQVDIYQKEDSLVVQIKEKILFKTGQFHILTAQSEIVSVLSKVLNDVPKPYRVGIEGHTDDVPILGGEISDNWELSVKRAHALLMSLNLNPEVLKRTVLLGYSEMQPLVPNRTPVGAPIAENQSRNRRVTIKVF